LFCKKQWSDQSIGGSKKDTCDEDVKTTKLLLCEFESLVPGLDLCDISLEEHGTRGLLDLASLLLVDVNNEDLGALLSVALGDGTTLEKKKKNKARNQAIHAFLPSSSFL
jgi:hypothetical protein